MEIPVVFEDNNILVIDKPSGITVNRSENEKSETIQDWVEQRLGIRISETVNKDENRINFEKRAGIVHRLDKDTSGVLLIAKDENSFLKLQNQFKLRMTEKVYYTLVHGKMETRELTINAPVGRLPWNRRKFGVNENGREAETIISVQEYYKDSEANWYSFIKVFPKTGRTHQIRIHLKHIAHPVVSDPLYAGRKLLENDLKLFPRLFLHAFKLKFNHPVLRSDVLIQSPLPKDLSESLIKLFKV